MTAEKKQQERKASTLLVISGDSISTITNLVMCGWYFGMLNYGSINRRGDGVEHLDSREPDVDALHGQRPAPKAD